MSALSVLDLVAASISAVLATSLALTVWGSGPRRPINRSFSIFALTVAVASVCDVLTYLMLWLEAGNPVLVAQLNYLANASLGIWLLRFATLYLGRRSWVTRIAVSLGLVMTLVICAPLFRQQIVLNPHLGGNGLSDIDLTPWGLAVVQVSHIYIIWALVLFWQGQRQRGESYLAWGVLVLESGFLLGGFLRLGFPHTAFPVTSVTMAAGLCILGYGVIRRQILNPLQESEATNRALLEAIPDAIFRIDEQGTYVDFIPAKEFETVAPVDQFLGKKQRDVLPPNLAQQLDNALEQALLTGEVQMLEYPLVFDERTQYYEARLVTITEHEVLGIVRDITERKEAEEELERYRSQLEELVDERTRDLQATQAELLRKERLSALGQLTATVAHEIRNPLGTVSTTLFAIGDAVKRQEMERVERALELAERNILRCDNIISELLEYTRSRPLQPQPTEIDAWLEWVLREQDIPSDVAYVEEFNAGVTLPLDQVLVRRAISNIVSNALDALEERAESKRLTVSTHVVGDRVEIRISDTGSGIPANLVDKVFEPLFSTKAFGVGLGLAIAKSCMEQHGGGIEIHSKQGVGTTLTLWLPDTDPGTRPSSDA